VFGLEISENLYILGHQTIFIRRFNSMCQSCKTSAPFPLSLHHTWVTGQQGPISL